MPLKPQLVPVPVLPPLLRRVATLGGAPLDRVIRHLCRVAARVARRYRLPDPAELVQIGLLAACELAPRFDPRRGASFLTFIHARAEGAMIDAWRRERCRGEVHLDDLELQTPSVEEELILAEECARLNHALASLGCPHLSAREREILDAVVAHDGSIARASRAIGVPYKTAYARWTKVASTLRNRVA
jgi:RNA polymerase sigma factor (sigma-70 family)